MVFKRARLLTALMVCALSGATHAAPEGTLARLLRFPDIHGDTVAFVYAGDIWTAPSAGGRATRLTSDEGQELFPKFSPDGRWIAFSAEYTGNRQVWVIPTEGGTPRQLTFYNDVGPMPPRGGYDYQVLDWSPDGEHVLFRANRLPWGVRMGRPYLVPVAGGQERPLPVPESGGGMFSPDGTQFVYTPIAREFRTWKRYRGGRAQDVWIFDLEALTARPVTDDDATDNQPVWIGNAVYFTSDRERRLNLYAHDLGSGKTRRVTQHQDFDVLWPSAGPRRVVYECGGYLYRFDPQVGKSERIPIELTSDYRYTLPRYVEIAPFVESVDVSPTGQRLLIGARGDVLTVPAKHGEIRNLTGTPEVREISPTWSPDGRFVAYLGDRTGEYELYVRAQDGSGEERRITRDGDVWRFPPVWSPDSKKLAFGDKSQRLRYVDVASGRVTDVDRGERNDITTYRWAPDSRWITYTKIGTSRLSSIFAYSLDSGESLRITDDLTNDYEPVFDPRGRYLYFLSDRDYNLTFSGYEFNYFYTEPTRIYAALLRKDGPPLFAPKSDEEAPAASVEVDADLASTGDGAQASEDKAEAGNKVEVRIDHDGLTNRVTVLPGAPANYTSLDASGDGVYYLLPDGTNETFTLVRFALESEENETILQGIDGYALSADGKRVAYAQGGAFGIVDAAPDQDAASGQVDLSSGRVRVDPRAEWHQIYLDAWRIVRDWFYDPDLHGMDWEALRELYAPWVDHVAQRADLDYILGELGGELGAGHFYVNRGDEPRVPRVDGGLLGAEIEAHESGLFRVAHIFPGENWHEDFRSPLTEYGVDIETGEFILAVDGRPATEVLNFYELLQGDAGRVVTLTVNDRPESEGAREARVRPVARETNLRYLDWVDSRRRLVEERSGGRIGYIHLPNTSTDGNRELRKYFYPQAHKDALIVDVRYNGGGFIPDRMIELFTRKPLSRWARRGIEATPTPGFAHDGPKVCLINAYSSSGGDAFPYYFRELGLGPLIGSRTWGGLIGLSGNPAFVDGGSVSVPTFRFIDNEGHWAVENEGVAPDIEVLDRPDLVARGEDPTLERAIEELLSELERHPPRRPGTPKPPRQRR